MLGTFFPPPRVSDPDIHHDTCVTHVSWCMPGSLNSGFLWCRWRVKRSRHSRRMRNPQFYVSGKRPMLEWWWSCSFVFVFNDRIKQNIWVLHVFIQFHYLKILHTRQRTIVAVVQVTLLLVQYWKCLGKFPVDNILNTWNRRVVMMPIYLPVVAPVIIVPGAYVKV